MTEQVGEDQEPELIQMSGADLLIRSLQEEGVKYLFGYPGGAVLHIYDALFQQESHLESNLMVDE